MSAPGTSLTDREPTPFDPQILRRSVISVPLREAIDAELKAAEPFARKHGHLFAGFNAAIFFLGSTKKQREISRRRVLARLKKAERELSIASDSPGGKKQIIGPLVPELKDRASLASLRGSVIRLLLAMDASSDPLDEDGDPAPPAIEFIWPTRFEVIIDLNLNFDPPDAAVGRTGDELDRADVRHVAKRWMQKYIQEAKAKAQIYDPDQGIDEVKTRLSTQYVFARLEGKVIRELVAIDQREAATLAKAEARRVLVLRRDSPRTGVRSAPAKTLSRTKRELAAERKKLTSRLRTIHHIWPDFPLRSCITRSISTVKADAAHRSFTAHGKGITWAVMDSGIAADHPHFRLHANLDPASTHHKDFTGMATSGSSLSDLYGHGTHVAGIIAGEQPLIKGANPAEMVSVWRELDETDPAGPDEPQASTKQMTLEAISGIAPQCKLVSLKVLDRFGMGNASNAITAIAHVQEINHHGRELHIHGVNLSLGYPFDPKWIACGHSPLCVEVNRLVRSGVIVVVAAGNSGYGTLMMPGNKTSDACLDLTINDPGNAEGAITVGSTHRDMPHLYGVSYFSSKGPTGDGRCKPDLLAPGEKIVSAAAPRSKLVKDEADNRTCQYFETSGTSMAAPHVSGAIAAAAAANSTTPKVHSLALLQAAFSHNGFSEIRGGFFRAVVAKKRVLGPILVTHTKNDKAVGLAYPAASRLSGDTAKTFGGPGDKFGGIGSNGAQQMNAGEIFTTAKKLLAVHAAYQWQPGKFHNLESSDFIVDPNGGDAHGFVHVPAVSWAISRAIIS